MNFQNATNLTSRELEVLKLLSQEYSTKEIANSLNLSCSTIESHRRNLLIKMKVKNVAGLIRKSFEVGILTVDKTSLPFPSSRINLIYSKAKSRVG